MSKEEFYDAWMKFKPGDREEFELDWAEYMKMKNEVLLDWMKNEVLRKRYIQ